MASKKNMFRWLEKNSLEIYVLFQRKELSMSKFTKCLENGDLDQLTLCLETSKLKICESYYTSRYTKLDCIDDILNFSKDKYYHLREIREVVHLDSMLDFIFDHNNYHQAVSLYYLRKLFGKVDPKNYCLAEYMVLLNDRQTDFFHQMMRKIDNYYIHMITK